MSRWELMQRTVKVHHRSEFPRGSNVRRSVMQPRAESLRHVGFASSLPTVCDHHQQNHVNLLAKSNDTIAVFSPTERDTKRFRSHRVYDRVRQIGYGDRIASGSANVS